MRTLKRKNSYYLQHSFRKEGKVITRENYIGKKIPKDIEKTKGTFLQQCRKEAFYDIFEEIKQNFSKEWNRTPESVKQRLIQELAISFTYNTNRIEGSTISEEETRDIISNKIAPNKPLNDVKETEKHAELFKQLMNTKTEITHSSILDWHKQLFKETKPDIAGKLRDYMVRVGSYRAPDWQDIKKLFKEFFDFYKNNQDIHPVELAARLHYKFEKVHPFGDGNGRIGRLMMNQILWEKEYPLLVIEYKNRKSYYKALQKEEEDFVQYFIRRYLKAHKKYLKRVL